MHPAQRLVNHVALVLDGSGSMAKYKMRLIEVADEQIRYLALRSEELQQETRVSVYLFDDVVSCLIFDMDVMRLPSIEDLYKIGGMTALIDATLKSQADLATTSQIYGDHAFLTFVLTDGMENSSSSRASDLSLYLRTVPGNWTIGFLVPDKTGQTYLTRLDVPRGNIALWDTTSAAGIVDAVSTIRSATDNFMVGRSKGVRGSSNVFSTGLDAVNKNTVTQNLSVLDPCSYRLLNVSLKSRIDTFVANFSIPYIKGCAYYQLTKTETIQAKKQVAVLEKSTGRIYTGNHARNLIGLPDYDLQVRPDHNPEFDIFVQSTSFNRNLVPNTKLLVMI